MQAIRSEDTVVVGYSELDDKLRELLNLVSEGKMPGLSIRKVAASTKIARSFLGRYKDREQDVCLRIMNKLANYFDIKYEISNFEDNESIG